MSLKLIFVLAALTGAAGGFHLMSTAEDDSTENNSTENDFTENSSIPTSFPEMGGGDTQMYGQENGTDDAVMATGELNPNHYPAQRAAKVVQHFLNSRYGSPYRCYLLERVYSANAEDVPELGRKYRLKISMKETVSNTTEICSAEVLFAIEQNKPVQVQASCEEPLKGSTQAQEEAFYQQHKMNQSLLTADSLPDSYGHIEPNMMPFWRLCAVASSSVMLNESSENTLYNMAQVANVTQLPTEDDRLMFNGHVLLHEMVSQEIVHWHLQFAWSTAEGVKVLLMKLQPHCHECGNVPSATN